MDGLECSEIPYQQLKKIIDYRIEPEYFSKKFISNEQILKHANCKSFNDIAKVVNGRAYASEFFLRESDLYISKIGDVTNKREIDSWEMLTNYEFKKQKGDLLKNGDILMTLTGDPPDVGKVNIIFPNGKMCTWNQRVAKIERKTDVYSSNYAVYAVLSSEICRVQMERFAKGIRQRNLGNDCFAFVMLPVFCDTFQKLLADAVEKHIEILHKSKELYLNAENLLLTELGINNFPAEQNIAVKKLADSFIATGRLDAEYYQPKYDNYVQSLNTQETVSSLCNIYDTNYIPADNTVYKYIELADVGAFGNITVAETLKGENLPTRARRRLKSGQVIISSVEGSLQRCALITDEYDNALCSTGFYVLDSDVINSETLLVLFKSEVIQNIMKQRCSGTILTAISKDELLSVPLPKILIDVQKNIAEKVQESFLLRRKSEQLLDYAKKAVEMAIEQDEEKAIRWLDEKMKSV